MADYDAGSVGGISVGAVQAGSDGWFDQQNDAGVVDLDKLILQAAVTNPLEPVYDIGIFYNLAPVVEAGGATPIRNVPLLVRTVP